MLLWWSWMTHPHPDQWSWTHFLSQFYKSFVSTMFLTGTMASHLIITRMMVIMVMMMIMMMVMMVMILPQVDSLQPSYMGFSPPEPSWSAWCCSPCWSSHGWSSQGSPWTASWRARSRWSSPKGSCWSTTRRPSALCMRRLRVLPPWELWYGWYSIIGDHYSIINIIMITIIAVVIIMIIIIVVIILFIIISP